MEVLEGTNMADLVHENARLRQECERLRAVAVAAVCQYGYPSSDGNDKRSQDSCAPGEGPGHHDGVEGDTAPQQWQLHISSPLTDHKPRVKWRSVDRSSAVCSSFCPCCRRPLDLQWQRATSGEDNSRQSYMHRSDLKGGSRSPHGSIGPTESYAYVSLLFGASQQSAAYAFGALALGEGLRATGTSHHRVLMHTDDVPTEVLEVLRQSGLWQLRQVSYLHGCSALGNMRTWHGIFTKLRLFSLTEYKRVLFLDLDMLILQSLDGLFNLQPPAAMLKGLWQPAHGQEIDGAMFFPTEQWNEPHGGINAGVMLLEPDAGIHAQMEQEVLDEWHPEHIYSYGPEQEYISRFFADRWSQISSKFNFQLYRLGAERALRKFGAEDSLPAPVPAVGDGGRARCCATDIFASISAIQYSSYPKPWEFVGLQKEDVERLLQANVTEEPHGACSREAIRRWQQAFEAAAAALPHAAQDSLLMLARAARTGRAGAPDVSETADVA